MLWRDTLAFQENVIGCIIKISGISKESQNKFVYLGLSLEKHECDK